MNLSRHWEEQLKKFLYYTISKNYIQPEVGGAVKAQYENPRLTIFVHCAIIRRHMRIVRGLKKITERYPNPVLTLGNFDGVHLGHQAIIDKVVSRAREIGGTSIAFTFEPHPLKVIAPERSPKLLNTFHGKMRLFEAAGIDIVICATFTRAFADQNPTDFAREILHDKIGVREVYVGYDYAFGKGREGSIDSLKRMGDLYGFAVGVVEAVRVNSIVVSSSVIRDLISNCRVEEAARLLGRYYSIDGEVVHGSQRGQHLGFPTANLNTANEVVPGYGVYAVLARIGRCAYKGVASIGVRPTFDSGPVSVEVHLFNFHDDVYGKPMELSFVKYLRSEQRFSDASALVRQIHEDVLKAEEVLQGIQTNGETK